MNEKKKNILNPFLLFTVSLLLLTSEGAWYRHFSGVCMYVCMYVIKTREHIGREVCQQIQIKYES